MHTRPFVWQLGHLLGAAQRTLLLMPAAEALTASLDNHEREGLPHEVARRLRSLLPYRSAREAVCDTAPTSSPLW